MQKAEDYRPALACHRAAVLGCSFHVKRAQSLSSGAEDYRPELTGLGLEDIFLALTLHSKPAEGSS